MEYRTYINNLDNDSLLLIFSCYRLEDEDKWHLRLSWRKLTHICRRWRHLIFNSSSHLGMYLLLTNGFPPIDTLSHLPPLPLIIDYLAKPTTLPLEDEENIFVGLQRNGHVHRVSLRAPSSRLRMWLELMNRPYPRLGDLSLLSTTTKGAGLLLPETFHAPFLRCLSLHGIGLPKGLSPLSSMTTLSTISLTHIRDSCYFSPGQLVTQLQGLLSLEEMSIGFAIPIPLPSSEGELLPAPIPPVTLPSLRRLTFRGVVVYLDNLMAQINTPLLERLSLSLFFDLVFSLVNLTELIYRTEGIGCVIAQVIFNKGGVSIDTGHSEQRDTGKFSLHINVNCKSLEWQIDSATQVCSALRMVLSTAEELTLDLDVDGMPSDWGNASGLDNMLWHELLLPFIGVKKLRIGSLLTHQLSQALESITGGLALDLLPELQDLEVQLSIDRAKVSFSTVVGTWESMGHPVHLLASPILHAEPQLPRADPEVQLIESNAFLKYMKYAGRSYRNQAMTLISLCRASLQVQNQTLRSYVELRR